MPMKEMAQYSHKNLNTVWERRFPLILYYLLLIITTTSIVELVIMPSLEFVKFHPHILWYLVNALLLTLVMLPVLYWFAIRQLNAQLEKLGNSDTTFKVLAEMLREGILVINVEGVVCYANPASCKLLRRTVDQLVGFPFGYPASAGDDAEITILRPDGRRRTLTIRASTIKLNGMPVLLASLRDITEQRRMQLELEDLATHDGLTGLYNHRSFYATLTTEIQRTQRYKESLSLLMLDIDLFKQVNDNYGHLVGDAILIALSNHIMGLVRVIDSVCRYGGEEFMVILPQTGIEGAMIVAEGIRKGIELHDFDIGEGRRISVTVSIGIASYPDHQKNAVGLVAAADAALYIAKNEGRNSIALAKAQNNA
jgi:two-component system, cell cycle response regulator